MMEFEPIAKMKPGSAEPIYWNKTFKGYPESIWSLTDMLDIYHKTGVLVINNTPPPVVEGRVLSCDANGQVSWVQLPENNNVEL